MWKSTRDDAHRAMSRAVTGGVIAIAFTLASSGVANASPNTVTEKEFGAFVSELTALSAELTSAEPTTDGEDAVAAVLDGTGFDADVLGGLIDETVALPEGVDIADGSIAVVSDEGDAASVTSGDLESGLSVTFEVPEATTVNAEDGVVVAESGQSETIVAQTTEDGGQLIYVMEDASADPTIAINTDVPAGYAWVLNEDGGASLKSADANSPLVIVDAPWAVDAAGTSLPTSLSVTEAGLVQTIDTTGAVFPVVADPNWVWWAKEAAMCLGEVGLFAVGGAKVAAIAAKVIKYIGGLKATSKVAKAWSTLDKDFGKFIGAVVKLLKILIDKGYSAVKAYIASHKVEAASWSLLIGGGSTIADILGIGHCFNLVEEAL